MLLQYEVDAGAEGGEAEAARVDSVDENGAAVLLYDAEEGEEERGLAAARPPHHSHLLPRRHPKAHSPQHVARLFPVAQSHVPKLDFALREGGH